MTQDLLQLSGLTIFPAFVQGQNPLSSTSNTLVAWLYPMTGLASHHPPLLLQSHDVTWEQARKSCRIWALMPRYLNAAALKPPLPSIFKVQLPTEKQERGEVSELSNQGCMARFHSPPSAPPKPPLHYFRKRQMLTFSDSETLSLFFPTLFLAHKISMFSSHYQIVNNNSETINGLSALITPL